jgi:hypothetical protein
MRLVLALVLPLSACLMVPRQSTAPSSGGGYSAPSSSSGASAPASEPGYAADRASSPAPAAPSTVSVTIRSACSRTVSVFYGDKPRFSSGTTSSISSNSVQSKTFQVGDTMWVLDDRGEGASSATISASTRNIEITSSCTGLSAR